MKFTPRPKHLPWDGKIRLRMFIRFDQSAETIRAWESQAYVEAELERLALSDLKKKIAELEARS